MSARIARNIKLLEKLRRAKTAQRNKIIKSAPADFILTLCEIAHNVLKGNIPLNTAQYQKCRSKKKWLRAVSKKSGSSGKKRKQLLCQSGGFLPALLGIALPLLTSLLTSRS